jgi:hypothetical protein
LISSCFSTFPSPFLFSQVLHCKSSRSDSHGKETWSLCWPSCTLRITIESDIYVGSSELGCILQGSAAWIQKKTRVHYVCLEVQLGISIHVHIFLLVNVMKVRIWLRELQTTWSKATKVWEIKKMIWEIEENQWYSLLAWIHGELPQDLF